MPFSHHSHSGQFCGHAADTLEEVVKDAISKRLNPFCLTEHIPRPKIDFYPEEDEVHTETSLAELYDQFYIEARRLQEKYHTQITLFIGFEGEWIRNTTLTTMQSLLQEYKLDLFVGSVHHVHTVPIDFDTPTYHRARDLAGGTDVGLFGDYFDSQLQMLEALKPPIVGHFDLIRLKSDHPGQTFKTWPVVWDKILRNLRYVAKYGGVLELNSSSLRKGMSEPYPDVEISKEFVAMGGRFTLSDDSHGVAQVGLNFSRTLQIAKAAGIQNICYLARRDDDDDDEGISDERDRFTHMCWKEVAVDQLLDRVWDKQ